MTARVIEVQVEESKEKLESFDILLRHGALIILARSTLLNDS